MDKLKGLFTAVTTSINSDGSINKEGTKAIVDYAIEVSKVDGLYVNGSTGEFPMLSLNQKKAVLSEVIKVTNKRVSLIAQVGSTSIFETIELGKYAKELGYDAISAVTPFYFKSGYEQYFAYYKKVAETIEHPIILYYIPGLTGCNFTNEQIKNFLNIEHVVGVKFSSPNVQQLNEVRYQNPNKLIWWGWDEMMVAGLEAKVDGFIGSTYAINGVNARKLIKAFNENNREECFNLTQKNIILIDKMVKNGLMETIKLISCSHYKVQNGVAMLPTLPLNKEQQGIALQIAEEIAKLNNG